MKVSLAATVLAGSSPSQNFENKIFDPFYEDISNISTTHSHFESIRKDCRFYEPSDLKDISYFDDDVSIIHLNARSIINKLEDVISLITEMNHKPTYICISETWLTCDIEDRFSLEDENYELFCTSRANKLGGGSAVYALKTPKINFKTISIHEFKTADVVTGQVSCSNGQKYIISQVYRPPGINHEFVDELEQFLSKVNKLNIVTYITGDFNVDLFSIENCSFNESFFACMCSYGFLPTISKATRVASTSVTLLDNIFCNDVARISKTGIILTDFSDHFSIFAIIKTSREKDVNNRETKTTFSYKEINSFKEHLVSRLDNLDKENDPEQACTHIINAYSEGISLFSHTYSFSRKTSFIKPWKTQGILCSINHKNRLFSTKLKNPSKTNISNYNNFRNCLNMTITNAKKLHYQNEFTKHKHNPKKTWEILQKLLRNKTKQNVIPNKMLDDEGKELDDSPAIADGFNKFFTEIGPKLKQKIKHNYHIPATSAHLQLKEIMTLSPVTENNIEQIILNLKNVGAGVDGINSKIFKNSYKPILSKLTYFFNLCLSTATFPKALKIAVVKPIFKNGDKHLLCNYRPISILPFMSKILEKVIYNQLSSYIINSNILTSRQFGFRNGHSTYMPIMLIQDLITNAFERNEYVVGIYLDLCKAFDTVDHTILIKKLAKYGINGNSLKIIKSYLTERAQTVCVNDIHSNPRDIQMGVPQGSILGPLLFNLYVNDLVNINIGCHFFMYADDTAIFFNHHNAEILQTMINTTMPKISEWLDANYLTLNTSKTLFQIYSNHKHSLSLDVSINGVNIKQVNTIKYLGILIDSDMKFASHINCITNVISRNLGIIARTRQFVQTTQLLQLYHSLIEPYINYCCFVWGSTYKSQINKLVVLQKRAMRIIEGVFPPQSANPIFKKYNILKITDKAQLQILLIMHRYSLNELPSAIKCLIQPVAETGHLTRLVHHFKVQFTTKNYRLFTFALLGPKLWNNIISTNFALSNVPHSKSVFKQYIKEYFIESY